MEFFNSYGFEIVGAIIGLLYLYLEYKASVWLWLIGILMPLLYIFIFFHSKFYADMGINVYYVFAGVYGWIKWLKDKKSTENIEIAYTPKHLFLPLTLVFSLCFIAISFVLVKFTDSPVPYADSLTTALSIIGMWLLAKKYIEHWIVWIFVDFLSAGLYSWKELYPTALLFFVYAIFSFFGYIKWKSWVKS